MIYFSCRKVKEPFFDRNPSYGLLFKMKRIGKEGKIINVYKVRTMHPYAEYLQEYIYNRNNLDEGGKFKDDFRITYWGKIFRKFWIDELPMLLNWLKGDLKLVGLRPLSIHYLGLYNPDFKERRLKYKPGLIPPYYVDLPKTMEEIILSEEKYLNSYEKHPLRTDIKYFFHVFFNIIFKNVRSR
jgi:lipopolysaccharide/colanic/teichoic acid biosynthesis glycosyltransferase